MFYDRIIPPKGRFVNALLHEYSCFGDLDSYPQDLPRGFMENDHTFHKIPKKRKNSPKIRKKEHRSR